MRFSIATFDYRRVSLLLFLGTSVCLNMSYTPQMAILNDVLTKSHTFFLRRGVSQFSWITYHSFWAVKKNVTSWDATDHWIKESHPTSLNGSR